MADDLTPREAVTRLAASPTPAREPRRRSRRDRGRRRTGTSAGRRIGPLSSACGCWPSSDGGPPVPARRAPIPSRAARPGHGHHRRGHAGLDRPRAPRRPRQRLVREPAVRDAHRRRPLAHRPPGPRRVVGGGRRRSPGDVHASRGPRVQRRDAADGGRRRPQLAPAVHASHPSPLASLVADVRARASCSAAPRPTSRRWACGRDGRPHGGRRPRARRRRPAGDRVRARRSRSCRASAGDGEIAPTPGTHVGSGGYTLDRIEPDALVLKANPHYWAGTPAIGTVRMLTTLDGPEPGRRVRRRATST